MEGLEDVVPPIELEIDSRADDDDDVKLGSEIADAEDLVAEIVEPKDDALSLAVE